MMPSVPIRLTFLRMKNRTNCTSPEERRRVYGANVLPHRPRKILPQLMCAARQDKVLVRAYMSRNSLV